MAARGATRTTGTEPRRFVRVVAVLVGLANLAALPLWFGDPSAMRENNSSIVFFAPVLIAVTAGLATSEVVLRVFELPGRTFYQRCWIVVISVCLGGATMGAPLSVQFAIDGTLGAEPSLAIYADPIVPLDALPVELMGVAFGPVIGTAEGLVLAAVLGVLRDRRSRKARIAPFASKDTSCVWPGTPR